MNIHTASSLRTPRLFRQGLHTLWLMGLGAACATVAAEARAQTPPAPLALTAAATPNPTPGVSPAPSAEAPLAEAEVRRVDAVNGRLQLRHGPIPSLDMPPMTMVFRVKSAALLEGLKEGDQILFSAEKVNGAYVVTRIEKRP